MALKSTKEKRVRRQVRIRAKISGTHERPRFSVFKSNRALSVQLIDDVKGVTLLAGSTRDMKGTLKEKAKILGVQIASKAKEKKITKVVFDRGGFSYTGIIATLADAAREGGLQF
jgi:large subunit ribosomal protein L18